MSSRLYVADADIRQLWRTVAKHRRRAGDLAGARHALWIAANHRTTAVTKRPEAFK